MMGFKPGLYWRLCWKFVSPAFLLVRSVGAHVLGEGAVRGWGGVEWGGGGGHPGFLGEAVLGCRALPTRAGHRDAQAADTMGTPTPGVSSRGQDPGGCVPSLAQLQGHLSFFSFSCSLCLRCLFVIICFLNLFSFPSFSAFSAPRNPSHTPPSLSPRPRTPVCGGGEHHQLQAAHLR